MDPSHWVKLGKFRHLVNQSVWCTSRQILSHVRASVSCSSSFLSKSSWRLKHVAALRLDDSDSIETRVGASIKEYLYSKCSSSGRFLINPKSNLLEKQGPIFPWKRLFIAARAPWTYGQGCLTSLSAPAPTKLLSGPPLSTCFGCHVNPERHLVSHHEGACKGLQTPGNDLQSRSPLFLALKILPWELNKSTPFTMSLSVTRTRPCSWLCF